MATHFQEPRTRGGAASKHRSPRINFGPIKELFTPVRVSEPDDQSDERWMAFAREAEQGSAEDTLSRFPIVRQGYDSGRVDEYIAELENELAETDRELAELRGRAPAADEVTNELKRIGEQTSAVLIAAHEQRDEILRTAREEADQTVAEARVTATTMTTEAEAEINEIEARKEATRRQRDRLVDEIRTFSAALAALVEPHREQPGA